MSTGQTLMTSAATGADHSTASDKGTPSFLQLLGKRVTNASSDCGLTYGAPVFNRKILSVNKDWQRSTPTAEESNYLSCFLCMFSPYRKRDCNRTEQASVAHSCLPFRSRSTFQTESPVMHSQRTLSRVYLSLWDTLKQHMLSLQTSLYFQFFSTPPQPHHHGKGSRHF